MRMEKQYFEIDSIAIDGNAKVETKRIMLTNDVRFIYGVVKLTSSITFASGKTIKDVLKKITIYGEGSKQLFELYPDELYEISRIMLGNTPTVSTYEFRFVIPVFQSAKIFRYIEVKVEINNKGEYQDSSDTTEVVGSVDFTVEYVDEIPYVLRLWREQKTVNGDLDLTLALNERPFMLLLYTSSGNDTISKFVMKEGTEELLRVDSWVVKEIYRDIINDTPTTGWYFIRFHKAPTNKLTTQFRITSSSSDTIYALWFNIIAEKDDLIAELKNKANPKL